MNSTDSTVHQTTSGSGSSMTPTPIDAAAYLGINELPPPQDGERLAIHVVELARTSRVLVDFSTMSGLTTAFGNMFFKYLFSTMAPTEVRAQVDFRTGTDFQRRVLRSSLEAALSEASANKLG